jgi:alkylation response protein AidB-like acyl-CoA dehydrogenase
MSEPNPGRERLAAWRAAFPDNWYTATPHLASTLARHGGAPALEATAPLLERFGRVVAGEVEPAVTTAERHRGLPALAPTDAIGRAREAVEFHPAYHAAGRAVWGSGILTVQRRPHGAFAQAAMLYLLCHAGEGGHACPVVCTAGLARALVRRGPEELTARYLDGLLADDYDRCLRASQFLTEVQGGSDVGANLTTARPDPDEPGAWRITGEKWFCSVADADVFALTARPEGAPAGTRGLGCFLVPRTLPDGTPNGFHITRLKDKLGTRALASGEITFAGALGWPVGPVGEGFRIAVEDLLNTSRWLNAAGSTGIMRRAVLEAATFARHREAFGRPIGAFPLVREHLAVMATEERAALETTMELTALVARLDEGTADDADRAVHRLLVNVNKYVTSIVATEVVHRAIEVLGGNGTIEDFSALPRLYRDAIVFESWEGTHNVLCAQAWRDCRKLGLLGPVFERLCKRLAGLGPGAPDEPATVAGGALERLEARMVRSLDDEVDGATHFRRLIDRLARAWQAVGLLEAAASGGEVERAAAELFVRTHLSGGDPADDPDWSRLVEAVAGAAAP